jgi:hypothetical protein
MTAILTFGGRQWNSNSLFSYDRDHSSSKRTASVKKSWSNIGLKKRNKFEQVCREDLLDSTLNLFCFSSSRIVKEVFLLNLNLAFVRNGKISLRVVNQKRWNTKLNRQLFHQFLNLLVR